MSTREGKLGRKSCVTHFIEVGWNLQGMVLQAEESQGVLKAVLRHLDFIFLLHALCHDKRRDLNCYKVFKMKYR